jgi:hypothetical protein
MAEPTAPPVPPYAPPPEGAAIPAKKTGPSRARRLGDGFGTVIGEALGFLVVFPVMMGLLAAGIAFVLSNGGNAYEQAFVVVAGLAFLFGLFVLVIKWGLVVFMRFWPIIIPIVGIVIAWKALT